MSIIDVIIILFLLAGVVIGFKKGVIETGVNLVGNIIIILFAFLLKDTLASILYSNLPFLDFPGFFSGVTVINILFYEALSFLIIYVILKLVLRIILKLTNFIQKILDATIILGFPSKILGAVLGLVEAYIFLFIILFLLKLVPFTQPILQDSKYTDKILTKSPVLSQVVSDSYDTVKEILSLKINYKNSSKNELNIQCLDIMLKYKIISVDNTQKLIDSGKLKINDVESILGKYRVQND